MPKKVNTNAEATHEQLLAVAMQLAGQLMRSKQYPRDFVVNYISSLLGTWLAGQVFSQIPKVGMLASTPGKLTSILSRINDMPTREQKIIAEGFESSFLGKIGFLDSKISAECNTSIGFGTILAYFKNALPDGHAYLTRFPLDTILQGSSQNLKHYLNEFPIEDTRLIVSLKKLLTTSEVRDVMTQVFKLGKKARCLP
jgi:hypothetical protein